jgi:deoxyguanosine kinase
MSKLICVEGNIGTGKTSLVEALCKTLNAVPLLEEFKDNPFLPLFYEDPHKYAYALEVSFLLDRYRQLDDFFKSSQYLQAEFVIADYFIHKCLIFAQINLPEYDFQLFKDNFNRLFQDTRQPDLIIYLDMEIGYVKQNIVNRGRSFEQEIASNYLEQVHKGYDQHLMNHPEWVKKTKHLIIPDNQVFTYSKIFEKSLELIHNL